MKALYHKLSRLIACLFYKNTIKLNLNKPIISFTFDDIPNTAITNGARILNKNGYRGTFYVSMGITDNETNTKPYFDHSKLSDLVKNGNELACHTYKHIKLYESNSKELIKDIEENQKAIDKLIPNYKFNNFSYPYGQQTIKSKRILSKYYTSMRGVNHGINTRNIDLYNLKTIAIGSLTLEETYTLIDSAILNNSWIIFYTHEVEKNPTKCGCTIELFEDIVNYCKKLELDCSTINEAIKKII